jgi:hypothetical protein
MLTTLLHILFPPTEKEISSHESFWHDFEGGKKNHNSFSQVPPPIYRNSLFLPINFHVFFFTGEKLNVAQH